MKLVGFPVKIAPSSRSPLAVVVKFPLFGDALIPCAVAAVPSIEFASATPEYSRMANRNVPEMVSDTVIVFAPPAMFST